MPNIAFTPNPFYIWLIFISSIGVLLFLIEIIVHFTRFSADGARLLVHIIVGCFLVISRAIFADPFYPLITGYLFAIVNWLALRRKFLSMHDISRKSFGSVYFPIAYIIMIYLFWYSDPRAFQIGLLLLALADPCAAIIGKYFGRRMWIPWIDVKSDFGTVAMFSVSLGLTWFVLAVPLPFMAYSALPAVQIAFISIFVAIIATAAESFSFQGSDNISVPLLAGFALAVSTLLPPDRVLPLMLWSLGSGVILGLAVKLSALRPSGFFTAWPMGILVFMAGGWIWITPIIIFFILSSFLTKIKKPSKTEKTGYNEGRHAGKRDFVQVIANGGIPMMIAAAAAIWQLEALYVAFLASFAGATADTWATEIGSWSKHDPRSIVTFSPVDKGDSGGVTLLGTGGSLVGAFLLAFTGRLLMPTLIDWTTVALITIVGFAAALFDSLLGATVQVRFINPTDGKIIEYKTDTNQPYSGWPWLDNNMVNVACSLFGAVGAILMTVI